MSTSLANEAAAQPPAPPVKKVVPTVTVKHGPSTAITTMAGVVSVLGGIAAGVATITDSLPAGLPLNLGVWIAGIGIAAGALKLAIVAAVRAYMMGKKAGNGLFDQAVIDTTTTTTTTT